MSGHTTVRLLFIVACTLAFFAPNYARPLEDDELSTVVLRLLQTSHLPPPQLSPAHRVARNMFNMQRRLPSTVEESKLKIESVGECSEVGPETRTRLEFDRIARQQRRKCTYSAVLHRNPAGPNPIGNEYRPGNTAHNVKQYRYPPQG